MQFFKFLVVLCLALGLSGCASKFKRYHGPEVTQIIVNKGERKMYLLHHDKVLKDYNFGLGFAPVGDKKVRGDGKTPEGDYFIDRRNPNSAFYLSIGISYPNEQDIAEAKALGRSPGGDIFIHGRPNNGKRRKGRDWTAGCITVTNREMRDIYAMVRDGTPIRINP
ncbi:L,D-transpeptidase catalytic domain [Pelagimonas phthalicica]|uniref:L,D-transpeptidase catalytic domain n=1 Tax=Pelagimonas phthalicica TaxID=1037362 RepID=A0A238J7R3_9RHOB|nr:L,D-transpeptidase family protein [Pelagimonas phthalicica]TDS95279.1 L,D-transpeptidase-like protein [Pelagimonas phthalicica]SMX26197.1 L,D-transpeptidase catalytic domain [Pelagimonas phthalicica]